MHEVVEVVLPPSRTDIEKAVSEVMSPFDESLSDEDDNYYSSKHAFWDFYVIGGRWSGEKKLSALDQERLESFYGSLTESGITVSGLRAGKQTLSPESQVPVVKQMWEEAFPDYEGPCPLFSNFRNQYGKDGICEDDICKVRDVPDAWTCSRLIVAKPHWKNPEKLEAGRLLQTYFWNGIEHIKSSFDGKVKAALLEMIDLSARGEYPMKNIRITEDWVCVTVDIHH